MTPFRIGTKRGCVCASGVGVGVGVGVDVDVELYLRTLYCNLSFIISKVGTSRYPATPGTAQAKHKK